MRIGQFLLTFDIDLRQHDLAVVSQKLLIIHGFNDNSNAMTVARDEVQGEGSILLELSRMPVLVLTA
jgi:hypothetical protein